MKDNLLVEFYKNYNGYNEIVFGLPAYEVNYRNLRDVHIVVKSVENGTYTDLISEYSKITIRPL